MKKQTIGVLVEGTVDDLILHLAKIVTKPFEKAYVLLQIGCQNCGKEYKYSWFNDLPAKPVRCECGNWIIKYQKKLTNRIVKK